MRTSPPVFAQDKFAEAEPEARKALEIRRKVQGDRHPATANARLELANNLRMQGKSDEADKLYKQAVEICETELGRKSALTIHVVNGLAYHLLYQGASR